MAGVPKLIILSEQLRGQKFELTDDLYSCGRVKDREIQINDPTISTHHCDFIKEGDTYRIIDRNSTNGTRVNNIPITEQLLQNTDILQVGGIEILYDCDDKSTTTVMKTQTGINLDDGSEVGIVSVKNAWAGGKDSKDGKTQKLIIGVVVFLAILVLALLGWLGFIMFFKK